MDWVKHFGNSYYTKDDLVNHIDSLSYKNKKELFMMPLVGIPILLTFPFSLAILHYYFEQQPVDIYRQREEQFIEQYAGIDAYFEIVDSSGMHIPDSRVLHRTSPKKRSIYIDSLKQKRVIENIYELRYPTSNPQNIEDTESKLQLQKKLIIGDDKYNIGTKYWNCLKKDSLGILKKQFDNYMEFTSYDKKDGFSWGKIEYLYSYEFNFEAPGYNKQTIAITLNPKDSVNKVITLKKSNNYNQLIDLQNEYNQVIEQINEISDFNKKYPWRDLYLIKLDKILHKFEEWIYCDNIPIYFKTNCLVVLDDIKYIVYREIPEKRINRRIALDNIKETKLRLQEILITQHPSVFEIYHERKYERELRKMTLAQLKDYQAFLKKNNVESEEIDDVLFYIAVKQGNKEEAFKRSKYISNEGFLEAFYPQYKFRYN
jgi:hypothetical protein